MVTLKVSFICRITSHQIFDTILFQSVGSKYNQTTPFIILFNDCGCRCSNIIHEESRTDILMINKIGFAFVHWNWFISSKKYILVCCESYMHHINYTTWRSKDNVYIVKIDYVDNKADAFDIVWYKSKVKYCIYLLHQIEIEE